MRRVSLLFVVSAILVAGSWTATSADDEAPQRGQGWWGDLDRGDVVDLADVVADPRPFTGRELSFFAIFRARDDVFVPQGTIFTPRKFTNLSIWPDGTPVWEQSAYQKAEFPFLYIQTTHEQRDAIVRLPRFTRVEITGRIRSIVRDRPFIEVTAWRRTGHRLGREVVDAMAWGDIYARGAKIELAAAKYQEALAVDLPPLYDMAIRKRAADALRKLGYADYAAEIERGETLGGTKLPEPTTPGGDTPMPGFADPGFAPPSPGTTPSGSEPGFAPVEPGVGFAPPTAEPTGPPTKSSGNPFLSNDLPGQPAGADAGPVRTPARNAPPAGFPGTDLPGVPATGPGATAPPRAAGSSAPGGTGGNPFLGDDLPGVPRGVKTVPAKAPPGATAPTAMPPAASTPAGPTPAVRTPAARPVLPPSRRPRLAGFK